jgi:hypothetical protein
MAADMVQLQLVKTILNVVRGPPLAPASRGAVSDLPAKRVPVPLNL